MPTPTPDLVAPEITYHVPSSRSHNMTSLVRPHGPSTSSSPLKMASSQRPAEQPIQPSQRADRNIEKVVLGDLVFDTWYPSYYGKELLGDVSAVPEDWRTSHVKRDRDQHPVLDRLYVCPSCFKYSKELVAWWGHVRVCEKRQSVPGQKIYVHPRRKHKVKAARVRKSEVQPDETVHEEGEWSIWEVDGDQDRLFCQNLCLFAKLWLDNKSIFFDVTGFTYFLLVYTPPAGSSGQNEASSAVLQIVGFFSKEKMSWDNNNLACILVFPPWQRKGLGGLLMSASYEISKRQGVIGGPEKPISNLGQKGYKSFWAGEIARWLLSLDEGAVVDIKDCSDATYICLEDCLYMFREMDLLQDAGVGPGKPVVQDGDDGDEELDDEDARAVAKEVNRVKVDKAAVRKYVADHRLHLQKMCDPDGFVEGYAMGENGTGEEEDEVMED
ncbi:Males-absent on the first protein-like protein [Emericellopsis cladophorae]|uniref:histone acetyltransferase n=1 Tax=Emericellopsis cladophorae TaxID=2686198 RepID=A0A9P9Y0A1_9HYPO|nr:Males-absent on the first protein-like protein [Emericellopsis cladophorae]KAI6780735.1 Males-absent on the first protein-like protein [Emericellopsis cladophorae]